MRFAWSRPRSLPRHRFQHVQRFTCSPVQSIRASLLHPAQHDLQSSASQPVKKLSKDADPEEAKPGKHHAIASARGLYTLHPSSPGSPLFQPSGTHVLQKLQAFLRAQYPRYGFREVITPVIYKKSLWEVSGHWDNYKDDMFAVTGRGAQGSHDSQKEVGEDEEYGLKPMNCPGHCLLFKSQTRSYKDLPIRYADFSPLHRNELSGALSGLTRLRRFHQDDAHIFCRQSQIKEEITRTLDFVQLVYGAFDLGDYKLRLGTRPKQYIGNVDDWDRAETHLVEALQENGRNFSVADGDGAFYGPKIDIVLTDKDGKTHQTATIQLDFQLPKRFALEYDVPEADKDQPLVIQSGSPAAGPQHEEPVLIHRAIMGSLERFMALLTEAYGGRWPFWMNPTQLIILTVGNSTQVRSRADDIAQQLASPRTGSGPTTLTSPHFMVECDHRDQSISKKIVDARKKRCSFYAVVGERDLAQPPEKQTLDLTLCTHPKLQDMEEAVHVHLRSKPSAIGTTMSAKPAHKTNIVFNVSIQQCQELMAELDASFI
ncbi:MAG: hypothetical protein Q9220_005599 [cf. Caloplaca sp. 1 TL-2023]